MPVGADLGRAQGEQRRPHGADRERHREQRAGAAPRPRRGLEQRAPQHSSRMMGETITSALALTYADCVGTSTRYAAAPAAAAAGTARSRRRTHQTSA